MNGSTQHSPYYRNGAVTLHLGDNLGVLPTLPDASVDAIVTDPPYGLATHHPAAIARTLAEWLDGDRAYVPGGAGFMGRRWDRFVPPPAAWDECLRILKPGGHLVAFAGARTADLMALSIRLAGFEIRDSLHWIYGTGNPKGQDIARLIDRRRDDRAQILQVTAFLAAARDAAGWTTKDLNDAFGFRAGAAHWTTAGKQAAAPTLSQWLRLRDLLGFDDTDILPVVMELEARKGTPGEAWARREVIGQRHRVHRPSDVQTNALSAGAYDITAPATDMARHWQGWNTQLKPAHEPIILARRPTGATSIVANVLEHGVGALNINGCRTPADRKYHERPHSLIPPQRKIGDVYGDWTGVRRLPAHEAGRWPTNVVLTHPPLLDPQGQPIADACADGCVPDCPVAEMDRQGGRQTPSTGAPGRIAALDDKCGASRFYPVFRYQAKAPSSERPRLADGTAWITVKPLALMRWLVRLVTPPGGLVVDPFAGTGTTLEAAAAEGFAATGIEREQAAADLCVQRLSGPADDTPTEEAVRSREQGPR